MEAFQLIGESVREAAKEDEEDREEPANPNVSKKNDAPLQVWTIAPLNRDQVSRFAGGVGVADAPSFLKALDHAYAWDLAGRPLDVSFLASFWKEHRRIGHPREMFEHLLKEQLAERPGKSEYARLYPLSPGRARTGAETLAAAAILCRRLDFRIADEQTETTGALDACACLPEEWQSGEIHALLSRPVFEAVVYGSTRFRHRNLTEYLAARWVMRLLENGCPPFEVAGLLFSQEGGRSAAKHTRLPVAVWLACLGTGRWVRQIREQLLECAPEAFFRFGDPSLLDADYKKRILDALVANYGKREAVRYDTSKEALSRMADPELAGSLVTVLASPQVSEGLKSELLEWARIGRVREVVPVALALLRTPAPGTSLIVQSMRLVEELGTPAQQREIALWLIELPTLSCDRCWQGVHHLFPDYLSPSELNGLLAKLTDPHRAYPHLVYSLRQTFTTLRDPLLAFASLRGIIALVEQPPHFPGGLISQRFAFLLGVFRPLLKLILKQPELLPENQAVVTHALWLYTTSRHDDHSLRVEQVRNEDDWNLATLTLPHPLVRRECFWMHYSRRRSVKTSRNAEADAFLAWLSDLKFGAVSGEDIEWLLSDLEKLADVDRRLGALRLAAGHWNDTGRGGSLGKRIRRAIAGAPTLESAFKPYRRSKWFLRLSGWWGRMKYEGFRNGLWWEQKWSRIGKWKNALRDWWWLLRNRKRIRSGKLPQALCGLVDECGRDSMWAPKNWSAVTRKYGKSTTSAAQEGCVAVWKSFSPTLENRGAYETIAGLAGLQYLWQSGGGGAKFADWSESEAKRATSFAVHEMNGFSEWLPELAVHHPGAVISALDECVEVEWNSPTGTSVGISILERLSWDRSGLGRLLSPAVLRRLQQSDPQSTDALFSAHRLLIKRSNLSNEVYASLAAGSIGKYTGGTPAHGVWLKVWLQTDSAAAMNHFDNLLAQGMLDETRAREFVVGLCAGLEDRFDREELIQNPDYLRPEIAARFIPWVYRFVSPETDIHRSPGSYTPEARDDAQTFRGHLLQRLANENTPEAERVMLSLLDTPETKKSREYILFLLDDMRRKIADGEAWPEENVRQFEKLHTTAPMSLEELYAMTCRRLRQIKDEVEQPEESLPTVVRKGDDESVMRKFLAARLNELSKGMYQASQESVVAGERRPDLRIESTGIPGAVPVEVKLADGRSVNELLDDLWGQLIGDYLANYRSRRGLFAIGFTGDRESNIWKHPLDGSRLDFSAVIKYLLTRAGEITSENRDVHGVEVIGLDFRPRPSARK